eukprot:CAMPEP_0204874332 /NCGR_PEP_ID=MMETSP1348-20121228/42717_1 /ASSEMBLY_ACC=CAM_ASM_000700 /TAXON_ID=215587 /ORGANISM="Aplanochytrium stocchinoi, Strain GSBS06" /LENGTH=403 /DNA_ID=CAMNT_0052030059 /DNA_START=51 /DNA_END=1262 /DNA_ORIENTATION=+
MAEEKIPYPVDYSSDFFKNAVCSEIRSCLINRKANACPMAVRLAWHASGTYDKTDGSGGSNGGTMRHPLEASDDANAGLGILRDMLLPVKKKFPNVSFGDIWTLAGANAVADCQGPKIPFSFGRVDKDSPDCCPPNGRLPDASQGAEHLREVFYRMGFNDREIVALSGAHTLGRCHKSRSGYDGPWTADPLKFDNSYFTNLMNLEWKPREWDGPEQFEDPSGRYMMLPTDMALKSDPEFCIVAREYADNEEVFFRDFSEAFSKLLAFGCPYSGQKKTNKTVDINADFREQCMHGSLERVQELVNSGADTNSLESNSGRTGLMKAAFWGHEHLIPFLLSDCKMDPNVQDYNGDTALHDAAKYGHVGVVKLLIDGGADASIENKDEKTAKDVAIEYEKAEIIQLL